VWFKEWKGDVITERGRTSSSKGAEEKPSREGRIRGEHFPEGRNELTSNEDSAATGPIPRVRMVVGRESRERGGD